MYEGCPECGSTQKHHDAVNCGRVIAWYEGDDDE